MRITINIIRKPEDPVNRLLSLSWIALLGLLVVAPAAQAEEAATAPTAADAVTAPAAADVETSEQARRIDILAEEIERLKIGRAWVTPEESVYGLGPAASKVYRGEPGLSIGGYGEVKYHDKLNGEASTDLHRVILYTGYKFNEKWVFNTEIEFEHVDEIAVEFAYIDYLAHDAFNVRAGHVLVPMGFINELHEPTTFFNVDRPQVERFIIPSTWHENGVGVFGSAAGLSYKAFLLNGFDFSKFKFDKTTAEGFRDVRPKGSKAKVMRPAGVVRLDYEGIDGLIVGGSVYGGNSQQTVGGDALTWIFEGHADYRYKGLTVRGLAAGARIDDADMINASLALTAPTETIASAMEGYYVEAGYDVLSPFDTGEHALTPFVQWSYLNTAAAVPTGKVRNPAHKHTIITAGVNYKPIDQIVLKTEYVSDRTADDKEVKQLKVALGWIF